MEHGISTPSMLINTLCTGALILFGRIVETYDNAHLPPIMIELLQACSYLGAITVSCFTIYNFVSKRLKKK